MPCCVFLATIYGVMARMFWPARAVPNGGMDWRRND